MEGSAVTVTATTTTDAHFMANSHDDCNAMQRITKATQTHTHTQVQATTFMHLNGRNTTTTTTAHKYINCSGSGSSRIKTHHNNSIDLSIDAGIDVSNDADVGYIADKLDALVTGGTETTRNGINNADYTGCAKATANMPCERYAIEYNMNHKKRGMALIFNHEHFDIPSLKSRAGTNIDCENLRKALKNLDFDVHVYKDCKLKDILKHTEKAAAQDHTDDDCILVAILSHGELGYLYARDAQYKLDYVWHYFTAQTCPSLAGKPKLFFIQACQGDRLDPGILMQKTETDGAGNAMSYKIPVHADFLIAYSTIPGFYSWRNTSNGSWFMQSLVHELNTNGKKHDILTLLTFVCQRVAFDFESCVPDSPMMHQQKQIPCITTMLTRILRFTDKPNNNNNHINNNNNKQLKDKIAIPLATLN